MSIQVLPYTGVILAQPINALAIMALFAKLMVTMVIHLEGVASRSSRCFIAPVGNTARSTGNSLGSHSLTSGPSSGYKVARFASFSDYSKTCLGLSSPPPVTVRWCRTWKITTPEFEDELPSPPSSPATASWDRHSSLPLVSSLELLLAFFFSHRLFT